MLKKPSPVDDEKYKDDSSESVVNAIGHNFITLTELKRTSRILISVAFLYLLLELLFKVSEILLCDSIFVLFLGLLLHVPQILDYRGFHNYK
jgi:hypothetical protein